MGDTIKEMGLTDPDKEVEFSLRAIGSHEGPEQGQL